MQLDRCKQKAKIDKLDTTEINANLTKLTLIGLTSSNSGMTDWEPKIDWRLEKSYNTWLNGFENTAGCPNTGCYEQNAKLKSWQ